VKRAFTDPRQQQETRKPAPAAPASGSSLHHRQAPPDDQADVQDLPVEVAIAQGASPAPHGKRPIAAIGDRRIRYDAPAGRLCSRSVSSAEPPPSRDSAEHAAQRGEGVVRGVLFAFVAQATTSVFTAALTLYLVRAC